jgi:hypothetical protein
MTIQTPLTLAEVIAAINDWQMNSDAVVRCFNSARHGPLQAFAMGGLVVLSCAACPYFQTDYPLRLRVALAYAAHKRRSSQFPKKLR